jgi:peroxiredoxin
MTGGRSDAPLDIGKLVLKLATQIKIGQPAPLFEVKTLDDKPLKLADFRGKVVLLDFWATWCSPCKQEMPFLKTIHEEFGKDGRFVLIGLSLDKKPEIAREYVTKEGFKWTQGFLGEKSKTNDDYGVKGIPATFLIGPDGKLIAKQLRGEQLKDAVAKTLRTTRTASAGPRADGF